MKPCDEICGGWDEDCSCNFGPCPFLHEYTYEGEKCNGYKYVGKFDTEERPE